MSHRNVMGNKDLSIRKNIGGPTPPLHSTHTHTHIYFQKAKLKLQISFTPVTNKLFKLRSRAV